MTNEELEKRIIQLEEMVLNLQGLIETLINNQGKITKILEKLQ